MIRRNRRKSSKRIMLLSFPTIFIKGYLEAYFRGKRSLTWITKIIRLTRIYKHKEELLSLIEETKTFGSQGRYIKLIKALKDHGLIT